MYNHALNAYHTCRKSITVERIVPEAEAKLLGLLPLTVSDALTLKKLIAPSESLEDFCRQEAGERDSFTDEALRPTRAAKSKQPDSKSRTWTTNTGWDS